MATLKKILQKVLNVKGLVVNSAEVRAEAEQPTLDIRVHARKGLRHRCPVCGRKCAGYDSPERVSSWRGLDFGSTRVWLHARLDRIECPEDGVLTEAVPWAYHGSCFTKDFDRTVAWMAVELSKSAIGTYMRIDWKTVGRCVSRARADIEPDMRKRFDNLHKIGIDETSYKKGHRYVTIVVNHEKNEIVWIADGHGKTVLEKFFREMTQEQRDNIEVVTGDGARWIDDCLKEFIPNCTRCIDPFHVVEWAMDAVDQVRREAWHESLAECKMLEGSKKKGRGRPKLSDKDAEKLKAARREASDIKNSAFALGKAPENLTPNQELKRQMIEANYPRLYRAYARKEELRLLLKETDVDAVRDLLKRWFWRATHSRIKALKDLAWKIRRHEEHIYSTIRMKMSNARIEATNNKIKVVIRRSYGFRNLDNMFDLVYLCCSNLRIPLPGRDRAS